MCIKRKLTGFQLPAFSMVFLFIFAFQFVGLGCDKATEPKNNPSGSLTNSSGCISYLSTQKVTLVPPCCTGLSYEYDSEAGTLYVMHNGAGFNCCTDPSAEITFDNGMILIDENESGEFCHCLCLYNIEYEFENITPAVYTIRFIEPYATDEDIPLELTFDLNSEPTGGVSIERNHYPWDDSSNPVGKVVDISGCGGFQANKIAEDTLACVYFEYDGDSILILERTNAEFNCCPETLLSEVNIVANVITIAEKDSLGMDMGCSCVCTYDFHYEIRGVLPGLYWINVPEENLWDRFDKLEFELELFADTTGSYCVGRNRRPDQN